MSKKDAIEIILSGKRLGDLRERVEFLIEIRREFVEKIDAPTPEIFTDNPRKPADLFKMHEANEIKRAASKAKIRVEILDKILTEYLEEIREISEDELS